MGNSLATLRENTVLCRVSGSAYGMTRVDKIARARAVQDGALPSGAKVLVEEAMAPWLAQAHTVLTNAQYAARNALRDVSMSYGDEEGWRIIPHKLLAQFLKDFATHKGKFNSELSSLKAKLLPTMVTYGKLDDETVATSSADLDAQVAKYTSAYTLTWRVQGYPSTAFPGMPEKSAQTLRERHEIELGRVVAAVRSEPARRLAVPVSHLIERLKVCEAAATDADRKTSLRASVCGNIGHAVAIAKAFNIYDDAKIMDIIGAVEPLASLDVVALRTSAVQRRAALDGASHASERIASFLDNPLSAFATPGA